MRALDKVRQRGRVCEAVLCCALTPSLQVCTCACALPSFAGMLNSCLLSRCEAELEPWPMTFHMLVLLTVLGVLPEQARGRKSGIYFAHILQPTVRATEACHCHGTHFCYSDRSTEYNNNILL